MLKHLTKSILCSLLWVALPTPSLSAPVTFQDPITPQTVTLSDGRRIPFGPGVICSNECVEAEALALPDEPSNRRWLWLLPLGGALIVLTLLPPDSSTPGTPLDPPVPAPVPETGTLLLLCAGLLLLSVKLKKEL